MINYVNGDATYPERICPDGTKIIVHIVNDIGAWGRGFVLALSKRWPNLKPDYQTHYRNYNLGDIFVSKTSNKDIFVVDLFGQHGIRSSKPTVMESINNPQKYANYLNHKENTNVEPIRYDAVREGLKKLKYRLETSSLENISIHMPKIGSGLAGGNWNIIEGIINDIFNDFNIPIYVYNFR